MDGNSTGGEKPKPARRTEPVRRTEPAAILRMLIKITTFAVFAMTLFFIALYCAGGYRNFPDAWQFALVRLVLIFSALLGVSALCGALLDMVCAVFYKRASPLAGTIGYVALLVLGAAFALGAGFILSVTRGNL